MKQTVEMLAGGKGMFSQIMVSHTGAKINLQLFVLKKNMEKPRL
jgi:hypothetical protein